MDRSFVLLRFRLYAFTEAAALRSIVLRSPICMRPDTHMCFFLFFSFFLEISLFPSIFVPLRPFSLCMESTSHVFLSGYFFFTL